MEGYLNRIGRYIVFMCTKNEAVCWNCNIKLVGIIYEKYHFFEIKKILLLLKKYQHRKAHKDIADTIIFFENFENER